jgi:hypothetical protein
MKLLLVNTGIYYFFLSYTVMTQGNPVFLGATILTLFSVISSARMELIPGMRANIEAQLEAVKTQKWLSKKGYYENLQ